jgi:PAS domain S-box-containing protein
MAPRLRPLLTPPNDGTQKENRLDLRVALKTGAGQLSLEADTNLLEEFLAHLQPEEQSSFEEAAQSALRASSPLSWNGKFKTGSRWRYMSITLHPPGQETAHPIWTGVLQDLTEIKGLQKRFESVLDAAQAYTWRRDMRLRVSQFGKRWAKFARHDDGRTSLTNEEWLALVHPDDAPRVQAQLAPLERGEVQHETLCYRRRLGDGSWVWLRVHAGISEKAEDGTPLAMSGISFDVTAEMQMHEQSAQDHRNLRNELERAQAALERTAYDLTENIPIGTYTMLLEPGAEIARFGFMSKRFLDITGLSPEQARTDPYRAFACVHPDDYSIWLRKNIHAFTYKLPFREETRLLVDGQIRWVLAESIPRRKEDGTWIWEGVIHDITSQKMAERALQEANKKILADMHKKAQRDKGA